MATMSEEAFQQEMKQAIDGLGKSMPKVMRLYALRMLGFREPERMEPMFKVALDALRIIDSREAGERKGVWKRSGLKGQCFHLFAKGERAFTQVMRGEVPNRDNFLDAINYAIFAELIRQNADVPEEFGSEPDTARVLNGDWPWEG